MILKEVVLLFTDIAGSTRLWDEDPTAMAKALLAHNRLVKRAIGHHDGRIFAVTGDGFGAVFATADEAVAAAVRVQVDLADADLLPRLWVREGVHAGTAVAAGHNVYGPAVNHCARITACARGGQIFISEAGLNLVTGQLALGDPGDIRPKDVPCSLRVHEVAYNPAGSMESMAGLKAVPMAGGYEQATAVSAT